MPASGTTPGTGGSGGCGGASARTGQQHKRKLGHPEDQLQQPEQGPGAQRQRSAPRACRVPGCVAALEPGYCSKYLICRGHREKGQMVFAGVLSRFCQQCGKFQDLDAFIGEQRSCRASLDRHRLRRLRAQLAKQQQDKSVQEQKKQQQRMVQQCQKPEQQGGHAQERLQGSSKGQAADASTDGEQSRVEESSQQRRREEVEGVDGQRRKQPRLAHAEGSLPLELPSGSSQQQPSPHYSAKLHVDVAAFSTSQLPQQLMDETLELLDSVFLPPMAAGPVDEDCKSEQKEQQDLKPTPQLAPGSGGLALPKPPLRSTTQLSSKSGRDAARSPSQCSAVLGVQVPRSASRQAAPSPSLPSSNTGCVGLSVSCHRPTSPLRPASTAACRLSTACRRAAAPGLPASSAAVCPGSSSQPVAPASLPTANAHIQPCNIGQAGRPHSLCISSGLLEELLRFQEPLPQLYLPAPMLTVERSWDYQPQPQLQPQPLPHPQPPTQPQPHPQPQPYPRHSPGQAWLASQPQQHWHPAVAPIRCPPACQPDNSWETTISEPELLSARSCYTPFAGMPPFQQPATAWPLHHHLACVAGSQRGGLPVAAGQASWEAVGAIRSGPISQPAFQPTAAPASLPAHASLAAPPAPSMQHHTCLPLHLAPPLNSTMGTQFGVWHHHNPEHYSVCYLA